jgi:integration host factor subunit alpha
MTITKESLIQAVQSQCELSKGESQRAGEALFEIIKKTLESGEDVLISGFGKFSVKQKNQRIGRNPATGDGLVLDARRVIAFKCSKMLRQRINGKEQ